MAIVNTDCEDISGKLIDYSYLPELVGHLLGLAHLEISQLCTEVMETLQPTVFVARKLNIAM